MIGNCPAPTLTHEPSICNCLPKRGVEQDLDKGINPLGSSDQGCYSVQENVVFPNVEGYEYRNKSFFKSY